MSQSREERSAYQKAYSKTYRQRPDVKVREQVRKKSPKYKAWEEAYRQRPDVKTHWQSPEWKTRQGIRNRARWPSRKSSQQDARLKRRYGLTLSDMKAMLAKQDGCCAICGTRDFNGKNPCIDHDHVTGKTRGVLCHGCNVALGYIRDNILVAQGMVNYLGIYQERRST